MMDMLISTMNGEVMLLGTPIPHHPLNSWGQQPKHGRNGFTYGKDHGIFVYGTQDVR